MGLLARIESPADVRRLSERQTRQLAAEIRSFLVESVSRTGGHLGPNLGVVELTIALHRVFRSPRDTIVFDTGHQAYVHKLLTGRKDFSNLRRRGGLSGYPSRAESEHDVVESSHASASLSWADGVSRAYQAQGERGRYVVAVIGDGALTGGMAWEALNNIAADGDRQLVIVVNDNGRSYAPTIGGLANHLDQLRTARQYEQVLSWGKRALLSAGRPGRLAYGALHGLKKGIKDVVRPQGMFEDLGLKYIGPVDGHDIKAMELALTRARAFGGPVLVHAITEKGRGYTPAEDDVADRFHAVGIIHPETGLPVTPSRFGWTGVFADEIVRIGRRRPEVVALTAAMLEPVGLAPFAAEFPDRVFDVGIAEQHAAASAAGLAFAGMHPVVALYATFLNRAFDQLLMDVALHRAPVTFVLDRSGITGEDGASHHGMWDLAMARLVPGLRVAAPRNEETVRRTLREATDWDEGPTLIRYPKGEVRTDLLPVTTRGDLDVLAEHDGEAGRVLLVGVGSMAPLALEAAGRLADQGIGASVVDPVWVLPVTPELPRYAAEFDLVVTIEDGLLDGGIGEAISQALVDAKVSTPVRSFGVPKQFISHASRAQILTEIGLTSADIARQALEAVLAGSPQFADDTPFG